MKRHMFLGSIIAGVMIFFSSCSGSSELVVSSRPETPYYVRGEAPGPGYVWIDGDWRVRNGRYYWRQGHWARPGTRIWVNGSWESRNGGWYWRKGHWR
jgi:hypothetical protein